MKFCILIACVLLLSACASVSSERGLAPIPTVKELTPADGYFRMKVPGERMALSHFKSRLVTVIHDYHGYAVDRRKLEWNASGLSTYGGLLAVAGALADRTGLLNTGAGVAGIGLVTSSRYNFAQQSAVYIEAVKSLSCIMAKVAPIPDTVLEDAMLSDDANAAKIAEGAIPTLISLVDTVRINANNGLLGIAPTVLSRDELMVMVKSYSAQAPVPAVPGGPVSADMIRKREAGQTVKTLLADVAVCAK